MARFGLCDTCVHAKLNPNTRGSVFLLCKLSREDKNFPKYPRVPVEKCAGFKTSDR
jgi:hypothetical protein